jgi:hypothetical protein
MTRAISFTAKSPTLRSVCIVNLFTRQTDRRSVWTLLVARVPVGISSQKRRSSRYCGLYGTPQPQPEHEDTESGRKGLAAKAIVTGDRCPKKKGRTRNCDLRFISQTQRYKRTASTVSSGVKTYAQHQQM